MKGFRSIVFFALAAVCCVGFVGCPDGGDGGDGGPTSFAPPTSGQLTITNIPAQFNGKYIVAESVPQINGKSFLIYAAADLVYGDKDIVGAKINNGTAVLKVWGGYYDGTPLGSFDETINARFDIEVFNNASIDFAWVNVMGRTEGNISFANGVGTFNGSGIIAP
jgi:hypothetical protein